MLWREWRAEMPRYKLKKPKNKSHIPFRLNLLLMISFLCFAALFIRLGYIQLYTDVQTNGWKDRVDNLDRFCATGDDLRQ